MVRQRAGLAATHADTIYNRYDVHGRRTWEIGALAPSGLHIATRTAYRDSDDKPLYTEAGTIPNASSTTLTVLSRTDLAYDSRRNPIRETVSALGTTYGVTQRTFDDRGRLDCEARRMNPAVFASLPPNACALGSQGSQGPDRITRNLYDAASQLLTVQRAYGTPLQQNYASYTYSPNGKRTSVTDANGNKASMTYDGFDRQVRWNFPSPTTPGAVSATDYEAYTYDAAGNRTNLRRRDGRNIAFAYDALNRVTLKSYPQGGASPVHYSYNLQGLQLSARFNSQSGEGVTNLYDGFARLVSHSINMSGVTRTLGYEYDAASNRTRIAHPDGTFFSTDYDALGRPWRMREPDNDAIATMAYDPQGRPSALGFLGGTGASYTYDAVSRLASLTHNLDGTGHDATWTYGRNPAGQITSRGRNNDAYAWTGAYDVSRNYTVNGLNQYLTAGPASFAYDANGNLISDGSRTFAYDIENRLVGASGGLTLTYDPLGRLHQSAGGPSGTTRFLYDGDALVAEYDGANILQRRYVHGPGADVPLVWYEGANIRRYFHADHQGSIVAIGQAYAAPYAINRYDEWGIPDSTNLGRFQYTGQIWLPDLGMYHYKARVYSPTLGRFMQTDPVGYDDQINLYAYVGNDPVNHTDPDGTCSTPSDSRICRQEELAIRRARETGVRAAWRQEKALVARGDPGTRQWTQSQRAELLRHGKVSGFEAHHINTVNGNDLALARDPNNIRFVTEPEHNEIHRAAGGCRQPICGRPLLSRGGGQHGSGDRSPRHRLFHNWHNERKDQDRQSRQHDQRHDGNAFCPGHSSKVYERMRSTALRMSAMNLISSITPILYRYRDRGSITIDNGTEFICKIDGAPMRFLHRLYKGSEATVLGIGNQWGAPLPASYQDFLRDFNGATLFDNVFHIYGLVTDFNRGLSLEDQRALSIEHAIMERRHLAPANAGEALPVASIAAATELFDAELRCDGSVILKDERGNARAFASFADFVGSLCVLLDNLSDENGLRDDSGEELQREMIGFITAAKS